MGSISIAQYRAAVGLFNVMGNKKKLMSDIYFWRFIVPSLLIQSCLPRELITKCGNVESNPGPANVNENSDKQLCFGHVNIRSIVGSVADPNDPDCRVSKYDLLRSKILFNSYDVFGVSETWLDSNTDINLNIEGYYPPERKGFKRGQ